MTGKLIKSTTICIFVCLLLFGCTRDDLCPAGAAVTPNLIIRFKDVANPENPKQVALNIFTGDANEKPILRWNITDSIALPLDVNRNRTDYIIEKYLFVENDTLYWQDRLHVTYDRKDIYVNRACGFRSEFYEFQAEAESDNWIQAIMINKDSITDEKAAHLTVFH